MLRGVCKVLFPGWWNKINAHRTARADRKERQYWDQHINEYWDQRITDVLACPDNSRLSRVANAGKIVDGYQITHNGLEVIVSGYYGDGVTRMLTINRGCTEPQEEVVFDTIIRTLPAGSVMVEAGAYWGFYSMWFCQAVKQAKVFLIEPVSENLHVGQRNFRKNHFIGDFTHAYVGAEPGQHEDGTAIVSMESFFAEKGLQHVHLLHADIQGFEMEMLQGMRHLLNARRIDFLFVSTHSMELHQQCTECLEEHGYLVLASVDLEESHHWDGVLVACSPAITPPELLPPSKKPRRRTKSDT